ncbi:MAG: helix-turn-helix transcriptional regulator [Clostridia bacterium]|nr:helix-turn-helix transcriptional regulator [Clostridia bacterium]
MRFNFGRKQNANNTIIAENSKNEMLGTKHITTGRKYNANKVANVECKKNEELNNIEIKGQCFLLIFLKSGSITFCLNGVETVFSGPSFICFDETENPTYVSNNKADYYCIYFHPNYLNVNMTFKLLRSPRYKDVASTHDLFMLKPFLDRCFNVPICESYINTIEDACVQMQKELLEQRDWYWSCRGRSHFMIVIIALERMYEMYGYDKKVITEETKKEICDSRLNDAVVFIEANYMKDLTLTQISNAAGINHATLTELSKQYLGVTIMEYLMQHRIKMAKKELTFTGIPIKEVASLCGFKTVQHFSRVFKEATGKTPAVYRQETVEKRKNELGL